MRLIYHDPLLPVALLSVCVYFKKGDEKRSRCARIVNGNNCCNLKVGLVNTYVYFRRRKQKEKKKLKQDKKVYWPSYSADNSRHSHFEKGVQNSFPDLKHLSKIQKSRVSK